MAKKETAEQKLLKIIESQGGAAPSAAPAQASQAAPPREPAVPQEVQQVADAVKSSGLPPVSIPPFLSGILNIFRGKLPALRTFGLREVNNILAIITLLSVIILGVNFFKDMRSAKEKVVFDAEAGSSHALEIPLPQAKQIQDYLAAMKKRNIFQPYEKKPEETVAQGEAPTKTIETMTKDLKLVGISWDNSAQTASVMIENTVSGTTYFLKTGETINHVTIKIIYADRVILSYQTEELTLRM